MNYKMVVFDLDGTLCNTLEDLYEACNYALIQCNLPKISLDQTRNFIGNGIKKFITKGFRFTRRFRRIVEAFSILL